MTTNTAQTPPKNWLDKRVKRVTHLRGVISTYPHVMRRTNMKICTHRGFTWGLYSHEDLHPPNAYCTQHQPRKPQKKTKAADIRTSRYSVQNHQQQQQQQLIDHDADCRRMNQLMENGRRGGSTRSWLAMHSMCLRCHVCAPSGAL